MHQYFSTCYPAGMGTSKIRLLFATLLQHYSVTVPYKCMSSVFTQKTAFGGVYDQIQGIQTHTKLLSYRDMLEYLTLACSVYSN